MESYYLDLTRKVTRSICGNELIFRGQITVNVSVIGKLAKAKAYILKNDTTDLIVIESIELFDLWDLPISSFCKYTKITSPSTNMAKEKFKMCQKINSLICFQKV